MKKYDVAALGSGNVDIILGVPSLPERGGKVVGQLLDQQVGGTVANSACAMARLGVRVTSVSCCGDDSNGQKILSDFKKFSVNCDFVRTIPGHAANMAVILIDDTGEKSLVYAPGDTPEWDEECARMAIEQSYYIYTMPSDIDKFQKMAALAQQAKTKIIVDIEPHIAGTPERLNTIFSLADIVIFNKAGFISGCGEEPEPESLQRLRQQYQLDAVVVTLDAEGVVAVTENESEKRACFDVSVIDTTGAGDAFNGAFIYSIINHATLSSALEFASATAAISITALGARGHLPDVEEVATFIGANK
ncbi:ribokinase/sulfofructose kinase [Enterobacter sp. BIGb0383]|uniref:carbohydrate kinase family protein n=1 Tax=unclassified Enterobacter TaxID=2608935 RepID=UPI000F4A4EAB|nr:MULTISPECIES: carbohydrate kinase family protein [unclassified Enterobacter]ROP49005.1 ribokinase/sulfofructose kinase [Enterobacter sp. BIGb0383]ROS00617.1 ribokinase/sulfofructose kinase [Enterobacter sp. BIGb0359]